MNTKTVSSLRDFLVGYVTCALWSSHDESNERGGEPMDRNYSREDIAFGSLLSMARDCRKFTRANAELLERFASELPRHEEYSQEERAGHDFWLTRNGHGSGFWDREVSDDVGHELTLASEAFRSCDLYVGDDGKIHAS